MRTTVLCQGHHVSFNFNKLRAMVAARVLVGIQLERHLPGGSEECLHKNSEGIWKHAVFSYIIPNFLVEMGDNRHLKKWLSKKEEWDNFHLLGFFSMIWQGLQQNHDLSGAAGHGPTHHSKPWKEPFLGWQGLGLQGSQGMIPTKKSIVFKTLRALFRGERFVHREKCLEMLQKLFRTWVSSFRLMKADGINKDGDQKMGNGWWL